jgi:hypothetical protein
MASYGRGTGNKTTSKEIKKGDHACAAPVFQLPGFPPSPAGNSAAEVLFEEPAGADLQTHGHPGTEAGGGCLETESREGGTESSLTVAECGFRETLNTSTLPKGPSRGEAIREQ